MAHDLDTLLEGAPAYGVLDAKDGVVLFRRPGHKDEFDRIAAEALERAGDDYEAIPLANEEQECDRVFIAPLTERRSFERAD